MLRKPDLKTAPKVVAKLSQTGRIVVKNFRTLSGLKYEMTVSMVVGSAYADISTIFRSVL